MPLILVCAYIRAFFDDFPKTNDAARLWLAVERKIRIAPSWAPLFHLGITHNVFIIVLVFS